MIKRILIAALLTISAAATNAQTKAEDMQGYLTYTLPKTTIVLEVEAVQEKFYAGPYAKYAEKYLGIKPRQNDEVAFQLTQIKMTPYVEADQSRRYSFNVKKGSVDASFLKLSSQGLISFSDANFGDESIWRFPTRTQGDFASKGVNSNLHPSPPLSTATRRRSRHITRCPFSRI